MLIELDVSPLSYYQYLHQNRFRKYISKKGREYKELLQTEFNKVMEGTPIYKEDCKVSMIFYFNNKRKNDLDNFAKPVLDCMSGIIFLDDRQVIELHLKKFVVHKDIKPKIIIEIT